MKRSLTLVCLLASGMGLTAFAQAGAAPAADPTPSAPSAGVTPALAKVAVIFFQAAVMQTNEGQRDFSELRKKYEPKQAALKSQNDEIDSLKKQLQNQSATLSDSERASRAKTIDDKEKALQRSAEDLQNDSQQEASEAYEKLAEKFYGTLVDFASKAGYTVVLDRTPSQQAAPVVMWTSEGTDITNAAIANYNSKSGVPAPPAGDSAAPARPATPRATTPRPAATPAK